MDFLNKEEGNIFFIPLFLAADIKDNRKNYWRYKFTNDAQYAYARLIEVDESSGDLVEVFSYTGPVPGNSDIILNSPLLMNPLHVCMGFAKKRWRFIFETPEYDRQEHSHYSEITFLLGTRNSRILWKGGVKTDLVPKEMQEYEDEHDNWVVYPPTKLEKLIREKN